MEMAERATNRLEGWKEIADYLRRDVRTAIRWHKERGMPVHRVPGGKGGGVFAHPHELDAWLDPAKAEGWRPEAGGKGSRRQWVWAAGVAMATVLALAGLLVYYLYRPGEPVRVTFAGRKMLAWDEKERVAWEYEFPQTVLWPPSELRQPVQIVDLDGDGRPEVLASVAFADVTNINTARELYCFSSKGKLLWQYRPQLVLDAPDRHYEGPWTFLAILTVPHQGTARIWVSVGDSLWWPGFVASLDAKGHATVRFINGGHPFVLNHVNTAGGSFLLAGGVNNEYNSAFLAVLKEDQDPASSPQTPGSRYTARQFPTGRPLRYILFPRSEINRVNGEPYNDVRRIDVLGRRIRVVTSEKPVSGIYDLSPDFEIQSAVWSSSYPDVHRRYEREGAIAHRYEDCPERVGPRKISVWDAENGWRDIAVPQVIKPQ